MKSSYFSKDVKEFFYFLNKYEVKYLIVGGEAVIYYGYARLTGDIGIFYQLSEENADRLYEALKEFWGDTIPGLEKKEELGRKGWILQFGVPPNRIDLVNTIDGISFDDAWKHKVTEHIRINKKVKRPKDLEDLKFLYQKIKND